MLLPVPRYQQGYELPSVCYRGKPWRKATKTPLKSHISDGNLRNPSPESHINARNLQKKSPQTPH